MRAAAEVLERAVGIDTDDLVVAQLADALELERVVGKAPVGLGPVHHLAAERIVPLHDLGHLLLDGLEVLRREGARHVEVVVEPVLDRRAEADAGAGKELPHGRGHDVGRAVPQQVERVGIAIGEDGERGIALDGTVEVPDGTIDPRGERRLGQPRTDQLGDVAARDVPARNVAHRVVRQGQVDLASLARVLQDRFHDRL